MRKFSRRASIALAVVALAMTAASPSGATTPTGEGTYRIVGGGFFSSATFLAFRLGGCNAAVADSPLNGVEALIVDVGALASQPAPVGTRPKLRVAWESTANPVLGMQIQLYRGSACLPSTGTALRTGTSTDVELPVDTRWLILEPQVAANLTLTITDITP